jgi:hypothetical protein
MAKSPVVYGLMASSVGVDVIHGRPPGQKRVINAMEEPNQLTRFLDSLARVATTAKSARNKILAFFAPRTRVFLKSLSFLIPWGMRIAFHKT